MKISRSQFLPRIRARCDQALAEGIVVTALQFLEFAASALIWLIFLPVTLLLHLAGFRRLTVLVGRIGHLAAEPDCYLKARTLGLLPPARYFMTAPRGAVANASLVQYWKAHISIVEQPKVCWFLQAMSRWILMRHDMSRYVLKLGASQEIYRLNSEWQGREPILKASESDLTWSDEKFTELGMPKGAWYVCVHVREAGFSPSDESAHAYRNSSPKALQGAIEEVVRRGGWCVRMGDPSMTPMSPMQGLIDYAHHPLRSDRLDVLLCARANFFLGNTSGLTLVSSVFGVPSVLANLTPIAVRAFLPGDIFIPKLMRDKGNHQLISFPQALGSPIGDFRYTRLFSDAGIEVVENTEEDIKALVVEMLNRIDGNLARTEKDDALQRAYDALYRPGHYSYGSASRVGMEFLRKYEQLLQPTEA